MNKSWGQFANIKDELINAPYGRAKEIIKENKNKKPFKVKIIPVYTIIDYKNAEEIIAYGKDGNAAVSSAQYTKKTSSSKVLFDEKHDAILTFRYERIYE